MSNKPRQIPDSSSSIDRAESPSQHPSRCRGRELQARVAACTRVVSRPMRASARARVYSRAIMARMRIRREGGGEKMEKKGPSSPLRNISGDMSGLSRVATYQRRRCRRAGVRLPLLHRALSTVQTLQLSPRAGRGRERVEDSREGGSRPTRAPLPHSRRRRP